MDKERKRNEPMDPSELEIRTADGKPMHVSPEGSLALLALGYKGLMAWRASRRNALSDNKTPARGKG